MSDKLFTEEDALTRFREAIKKMLSRPVERLEPECRPGAVRESHVQGR